MALASGLGVGGAAGEPLAVSLLVDWLTGLLGGPEDQAQAAQVCATECDWNCSNLVSSGFGCDAACMCV